jgi:putative cardiolipin synthase
MQELSRPRAGRRGRLGHAAPAVLLAALALLAAGCASLPKGFPREASTAWDRPQETRLGREFAEGVAAHPGASGFHTLASGMDAFIGRMALAEAADRTLDLQYYIFHGDLTGKLILGAALEAAERGVRVRILVDDTTAKGRDAGIVALSTHPLVQVRVFNPSAGRSSAAWVLNAAGDFERINHRMHNKMFVADNQAAIIGGRNIGDEYFGAQQEVNFADMDLLLVGPAVQELSRSFDLYWNSALAYPIEAFHKEGDAEGLRKGLEDLRAHRVAAQDSEYGKRLRDSALRRQILDHTLTFTWAPAQVFADRPEKAAGDESPVEVVKLGARLRPRVENAGTEVLISSPYFIPGKRGMQLFKGLREKGVRVRIITNSFAGNDVAVVHSGYAQYRKELLGLGVELFELKPSLGAKGKKSTFGSSGVSLHAKVFVIDRGQVFVGSLNLDPRSVDLNTELGVVVESPALAAEVSGMLEGLLQPAFSYRLTLEGKDKHLVWTAEKDGKEVRYTQDPEVSAWRRFTTWLMSALAPESLL